MRVLLANYDSRGGLEPLLGLAVRLRGLGAEVRVCAPPDGEFARRLAGVGVPLVPFGRSVRALMTAATPPTACGVPRRAAELLARFDTVAEAAEGCDVLVATGLLPAAACVRSVADKLDIPYVYASFQSVSLPSPHHPPMQRPGKPLPPDVTDNRALWDLDAQSANDLFREVINAHRASVGLPPVEDVRDHVFTDRPWLATDPVLDPWEPWDPWDPGQEPSDPVSAPLSDLRSGPSGSTSDLRSGPSGSTSDLRSEPSGTTSNPRTEPSGTTSNPRTEPSGTTSNPRPEPSGTTSNPRPEPSEAGVVQTGTWIVPDERPLPPELTAFLDAGAPPVYVGFGSITMGGSEDVAWASIEAVRAQGRRAIVSRGWAGLALVDDRDDCFVVGETNHHVLFRRVAAVIHHGGSGTTTTATWAGAPQVVVPQGADQPYFASRVAALGIGAAHDGPTPTFESLSAALEVALAPETRVRAAAVAQMVHTDGAAVAAKLLLDTIVRS
ncbi:nucleotide disphospho-sugar-binding domain-containing protein [Streptomyces europaeiscabiei]|uniref:nucleotide disphospho-sugar-binding domain-containing protein n=1 Tax=Streptomyces europaeiscabiei TaxID=146819 RepID=UPI002E262603|nr:glycosyltransferase [Streptomyces europaeiscabiei]